MGLGLAITRSLVELHAGSIRAESDGVGLGSTFTLEFPLLAEEQALPNAPAKVTSPAGGTTNGLGHQILLLEDHAPTRDVLSRMLGQRGYRLVTAASISEARSHIETGKISLIISDIGLPDGSGWDFLTEVREQHGIRGIAMTGYGMEDDVANSERAGAVAHLTKPVQIGKLEAALTTGLADIAAH